MPWNVARLVIELFKLGLGWSDKWNRVFAAEEYFAFQYTEHHARAVMQSRDILSDDFFSRARSEFSWNLLQWVRWTHRFVDRPRKRTHVINCLLRHFSLDAMGEFPRSRNYQEFRTVMGRSDRLSSFLSARANSFCGKFTGKSLRNPRLYGKNLINSSESRRCTGLLFTLMSFFSWRKCKPSWTLCHHDTSMLHDGTPGRIMFGICRVHSFCIYWWILCTFV